VLGGYGGFSPSFSSIPGAAKHAAAQGWISADALPAVSEEKKADEGKDDSKVPAPGIELKDGENPPQPSRTA